MSAVDRIFDVVAQLAVGAFFGLCHAQNVLRDVWDGFRQWGFRYGMRSLWKAVRELLAFLFAIPCRVLWLVLGFAGAALEDLAQCMLYLKYFVSYGVLRIDRWCLALALLGLSMSAVADAGRRVPFPEIPRVRHVDSESSVCVPVTNSIPSQTEFGFDLSFAATSSNNVSVAIGEDGDGDGDLSFSETDVVVGWDCGRYFVDRPKAGRRYESAVYPEAKDRTLSYVYRISGLGGDMESFRIDVDEGAFGPDGVEADGSPNMWAPTFSDTSDRHRIRWETTRGYGVYGSGEYSTLHDVRFSAGLVAVYPSSVVSGGRVAANLFGVSSAYVVYLVGATFDMSASGQAVTVSGTGYPPRGYGGYGGAYVDVVGAGEVEFSLAIGNQDFTTRVYVDDEFVASYSYGSGVRRISVGHGSAAVPWAWRPGWNMFRVTRRGRFPDSGPSGGFTVRQRGGIIQLH